MRRGGSPSAGLKHRCRVTPSLSPFPAPSLLRAGSRATRPLSPECRRRSDSPKRACCGRAAIVCERGARALASSRRNGSQRLVGQGAARSSAASVTRALAQTPARGAKEERDERRPRLPHRSVGERACRRARAARSAPPHPRQRRQGFWAHRIGGAASQRGYESEGGFRDLGRRRPHGLSLIRCCSRGPCALKRWSVMLLRLGLAGDEGPGDPQPTPTNGSAAIAASPTNASPGRPARRSDGPSACGTPTSATTPRTSPRSAPTSSSIHCHPTTPTTCANAANWGDEVKQTDATYNMRSAPFARGWFIGDYVGMDSDGADFLPFWSQPFGTDPANVFLRRVGLVPGP
jgi:hypothetical protein